MLIAFSILVAVAVDAHAQFWEKLSNPQVSVEIKHPPMTGLMLKRAAIGKVSGTCGEEVAEKLGSLLSAKMEVLDRANLDAILREQHFNLSEFVDVSSASRLGRILGPTALVFIRANCRETQQPLRQTVQRGNERRVRFISRTTVTLRGSVQVVDLETARVFQQMPLEITRNKEHTSEEGQPEFPLVEDVLSEATNEAVWKSSRLLLPWSEIEKVYFYDDKDCDLKSAFDVLRMGQVEKAVEASRRNVEACEAKQFKNEKDRNKNLGKAYYNLGVALMLNRQYDEAQPILDKVVQLRGAGDIVREAIARNMELKSASESMLRTVQRTEQFEETRAAASSPASAWSGSGTQAGSSSPGQGGGTGSPTQQLSPADRLRNLEKLFKEGLLSKEEYEKKRAAIIAEM